MRCTASACGSFRSVTTVVAVASLMLVPIAGRAQDVAGDGWATPRTPWGDPDLQGMWPSGTVVMVPFERAEALGTRAVFTEEEYAEHEQGIAALEERLATRGTQPSLVFSEVGRPPPQASLVVDPDDGRLPPMTDDGARRAHDWRTRSEPTYPHASVKDFRPYERCISRGVLGSAFPNIYASVMWVLQTPGFVIIHHEMVHETRVIPLDGRPHIAPGIRHWMGDSRGRWDGDTLVVETTNLNGRTGSYARNGDGNPTSEALRLVERIRLRDDETLDYEVRVEDSETWTKPWTVAFSLPRDDDYVIYEYACHEGNHALGNVLRTVRAAERNDGP